GSWGSRDRKSAALQVATLPCRRRALQPAGNGARRQCSRPATPPPPRHELERRVDAVTALDLQPHTQRIAFAAHFVALHHLARRVVASHRLAAGDKAQPAVAPFHVLERARHAEEAGLALDAAV